MIRIISIKNYNDTKNELKITYERIKSINLLEEEKELLKNKINNLQNILSNMEDSLKLLSGIENKIYYQIVIEGLNVTKAIDKISFEADKDPSTIWKYHYPKVKKELEKIR